MSTIKKILKHSPIKKQKFVPLLGLLYINPRYNNLKKFIRFFTPFGVTVDGQQLSLDIRNLGSLLVAGNSDSGKTTFLKSIISSILMMYNPKEIKFIIATSKPTEYAVFEKSTCLSLPIIEKAEEFTKKMESLVDEMEARFEILSKVDHISIKSYNYPDEPRMQYIFVIADNFSEIFKNSSIAINRRFKKALISLLQMGRGVGIYIIIASRSLNERFFPGIVKANMTNRLSFRTANKNDSRDILDMPGTEKLIGKGDAIINHYGDGGVMLRIQTPYITDKILKTQLK